MRVLVLNNNDIGLQRFRKELLSELLHPGSYLAERVSEEPCDVFIALPEGERVQEMVDMGCRFIDVPVDRRGTNPVRDCQLFFTYLRLLKEIKPDAVLTFTIKPNIFGGLACRQKKIPYFPNITGLGTSLETPGILQKLILHLYRIGISDANCTFFQNQANMDFMQSHHVGNANRHKLPGSGVDLVAHTYRPYPSEEPEIKFLSLMRIMDAKGISELIACAERIKKVHPHVSFSLAGMYDDERYREPVEKAHQEGWINYLGFRSDIAELIEQHHCLIHPSHHEGLSNVLLEAAACGRPVIASNVPGCVETFDEGISGFGFEAKNTDRLTQCVEKFISLSSEAREQMGKAGRKKVETEFDRKLVVRTYIDYLKKIKQ